MAAFGARDTVASLLVDKSASPPPGAKPGKAPDTEKKHHPQNNDGGTMEALLEGSGGPDTPAAEGKAHFAKGGDAMVGGDVGLTTDSQAAHMSSIAMVAGKPAGHGNLTHQDTAPSNLSPQHVSTKRMFDDQPCGVESEPSDGHPPKRPRADLDDSRVKAALDETAPDAGAAAPPPSKKQVLDAQNKQSHVLQDARDAPPPKFTRKHFDPTDNALKDSVILQHPLSGEKAPRQEKPIPVIAPSCAPIAGVAASTTNRVKKLENTTNAPVGAGKTSTEINKPVASHTARAAPAGGAGLNSTTQHHVKRGIAEDSVTATAHRAAMGGTDASACMKWD